MKKMLQKGFTLIELLVVITIIGILATGAVTVYTSQIQKARDTTRIGDISAIRGAIEQIYQDDFKYPNADATLTGSLKDYMQRIPQDVKHGENCASSWSTNTCGYIYNVWTDKNGLGNGAYEISSWVENKGNLDGKASQAEDGGEDDNRIEIGILKTGSADTDIVTTWIATNPEWWVSITR